MLISSCKRKVNAYLTAIGNRFTKQVKMLSYTIIWFSLK